MAEGEQEVGGPAALRCAIYTRKSTEEGLEQEFNSLDGPARSSRSLHRQPDEARAGRLSRSSMMMADSAAATWTGRRFGACSMTSSAGRIDCVVVYKVDRLSRSLLDFARIIGVFDSSGVSFVSVTQQFNTSAPLGRLTLNILLSFAQFEREIIGERTRDKIQASRARDNGPADFCRWATTSILSVTVAGERIGSRART